jgi:hypothetical protein
MQTESSSFLNWHGKDRLRHLRRQATIYQPARTARGGASR